MSWPNWVSKATESISQMATAVAAFFGALFGWINRKKIHEVHLTMNSRLDELLRTTKESAHEKGRKEGIEAEQQRMRPADPAPPAKKDES